ncbi:MAG: acyl-CoA dehydrogenase [Rhodospirillaceae bacterium]|nr:acyl-CoA dehydrogenase [Rhodospirillaceae bacterium]
MLDTEALAARPRFAGQGREIYDAALETAKKIATEYFANHYRAADIEEPRLENGKVTMRPEVKQAVDAFAEAGFLKAHHDESMGGLQLPWSLVQGCFSLFQAANIATAAYPFLTIAAGNLLARFATPAQQETYLPPMLEGRFFGTMCLSEPQAGSSLSDIRTMALPDGEGDYRIQGVKQWISGGEHELSENIIHLVLARIQGAPAGVKGLSLFIVPRYRLTPDGKPDIANDVQLVSLLHKMGYRGTTSTILRFGEEESCRGELIGEAHKGLYYMFQMMNEARIGVGLGAAMLAHAGYLHALNYARERPQGRHVDGKDAAAPQVAIIEHADIKRMLLAQKAIAEGAMALCFFAANLVDQAASAERAEARQDATTLLDLLTPICKAWPSHFGPRANDMAIQIMGGYGYTRDYPVEQMYRDNRLNPIHEGTDGIQAIDLLGRKVGLNQGRGLELLAGAVAACCAEASQDDALAPLADALQQRFDSVREVTAGLLDEMAAGASGAALANASLYLEAFGHTVIAWMWLRQAVVALRLSSGAEKADGYLSGKIQACRYFFAYELPRVDQLAAVLRHGDQTCAEMPDNWF